MKKYNRSLEIIIIVIIVCCVLSSCGHPENCIICGTEIKDGEHTVNANYGPVDVAEILGFNSLDENRMSGDDVVCEACQLKYTGHIAGHCYRCMNEYAESETIYYGGDYPDGVCEACAIELWGEDRIQYAMWTCESCGITYGSEMHRNFTETYNESGICDNCYAAIFG